MSSFLSCLGDFNHRKELVMLATREKETSCLVSFMMGVHKRDDRDTTDFLTIAD